MNEIDDGDALLAHELDALLISRYPSHRDAYVAYIVAKAAAEAAPLDVERLARAIASLDDIAGTHRIWRTLSADWLAEAIVPRYAALRSPDTETAGEAG